jgi:predicted transposase YbfD/YdcC
MTEYIAPTFDVNIDSDDLLIDLNSLYEHLTRLHDSRDARGMRYALATVLVYVVLAKLAGEDRLAGIADWVAERQELLAEALHLKTPRAPHLSTYSRVLGHVVDVNEFEQVVHDFFAAQPHAGESLTISLDGKTLRGTIRAGETHGVHLLAAYLTGEGWVLFQVVVGRKANEITVAPHLLKRLDLRGKIVTGDALLAQRELSAQIVAAGGNYVWTVKENQPELVADVARLFAPEPVVKGFSPASHDDFQTRRSVNKAHGRLEKRTITVSQALNTYVQWPAVGQVFHLERQVQFIGTGKKTSEVVYGITSLTPAQASPERLLEVVRGHWAIENGLHYRRDETMREDWYHVRTGHAPQVMAALNNLVLGLLLTRGVTNVPKARRHYEAHLDDSVALVLRAQT